MKTNINKKPQKSSQVSKGGPGEKKNHQDDKGSSAWPRDEGILGGR